MTMRRTFLGRLKSIAGMALIGFGLLILCGNLADVAVRVSRLVGISAEVSQTFGVVTAVGLAASQVWQSYVFDRRELLLGVWQILISFWPLLLVMAGTVLTGMASESM
jgi:ascorbate-specific PTS system EIIC-type component UlaA